MLCILCGSAVALCILRPEEEGKSEGMFDESQKQAHACKRVKVNASWVKAVQIKAGNISLL